MIDIVREWGIEYLTTKELVSVLIKGNTPQNIIDESVMNLPDSLIDLAKMQLSDLEALNISSLKAVQIMATFELGRRKMKEETNNIKVGSVWDSIKLFQPNLMDLQHEEFHVAFMNRKLRMIKYMKLFKGGTDSTTVDVKVIMKHALSIGGVYGIICAHNHPSGNIDPSAADKNITQKIKDVCIIADVKFLDHLIIAGNKYYSFQES